MICFFFNDTATTEIYTLSLHDALPIWPARHRHRLAHLHGGRARLLRLRGGFDRHGERLVHEGHPPERSEEHTSELQSRQYLVCRLLLEKKKPTRLCTIIRLPFAFSL